MIFRHKIAFILMMVADSTSFATNFQQDLDAFKYALSFSKMSQDALENYLDPNEGPTQFRLNYKNTPWGSNFFPMTKGGIANRWKLNEYPLNLHTKDSILAMTPNELQKLSPVEKFDIFMGYYDFRTTKHELDMRGPLRVIPPEDWEGFCNGARCAGILTQEPKHQIQVINKDGIIVQFSPVDLKALASASYFYVEKFGQIGNPSMKNEFAKNQPNPVIFDLALRLHIAKYKKAFVIDSNLGPEIWNETVVGYNRRIGTITSLTDEEKNTYPSALNKVWIGVTLETLGEIDIKDSNHSTKRKISEGQFLTKIETGYTLYLDSNGKALDGIWHNTSGLDGIDFAWFAGGRGADRFYVGGNPHLNFSKVKSLINKSTKPQCSKLFSK